MADRSRHRLYLQGYTLLETLGVLIILSILSAIVAANLLKRMKEANREVEVKNLSQMSEALGQYIQRERTVPSQDTLAQVLADEMGKPLNKMTVNKVGLARLFWIDPALRIGTNSSVQVLPYLQDHQGSLEPASPRLMIVSSLTRALPTDPGTFDQVWSTANDSIPSGWPSVWNGSGEDLKICRIRLAPLFHRVVFYNNDYLWPAPFSIENSPITYVAYASYVERWFLHGTVFNAHYADATLQTREVVQKDTSYSFENRRWSPSMVYGPGNPNGSFGQLADLFLGTGNPPANPNQFGATVQSVADELFGYLTTYEIWAWGGFATGGTNAGTQTPEFRRLIDCQVRVSSFTTNLLRN